MSRNKNINFTDQIERNFVIASKIRVCVHRRVCFYFCRFYYMSGIRRTQTRVLFVRQSTRLSSGPVIEMRPELVPPRRALYHTTTDVISSPRNYKRLLKPDARLSQRHGTSTRQPYRDGANATFYLIDRFSRSSSFGRDYYCKS